MDGLDDSLGNWLVDFVEWRYVSRWKSGRVEALYAVETKLTVYDLTQSPHILPPFRKLKCGRRGAGWDRWWIFEYNRLVRNGGTIST